MKMVGKVVGRGRKKKHESIEHPPAPLKKKRGRKLRSPSPALPNPSSISFFKVMIGDFKDVLYIPPMAACTLKGLDKKSVYIEDANGKYWNVKMSMIGGSLAFQKGWDDFFSAHSITVGEFVLFTYSGGLLFTARIFGTSSLERVDFQKQKKRGKCEKERCTSELKPDNDRPSKRKKASNASEDNLSPSDIKPLRILRRGKGAPQFNFPNIEVVEIDPLCEVLKVPNSCEEPLQYNLNSKESETVPNSFEPTWRKNVDATIEEVKAIEELNIISPTEQVKLGLENHEVEKAASLFHSGVAVDSEQETKPDTMTVEDTLTLKSHSDIKEEFPEMTSEGSPEMTSEGLTEMTSEGLAEMTSEGLAEMTSEGFPEMTSERLPEMTSQVLPELAGGLHEETEVLFEVTSEGLPEVASKVLPEMTLEELSQMCEPHSMGINGATEASDSYNLQMLDTEPHIDNMATLCNLDHVKYCQMEFNMIQTNEIVDKVVQTADEICHTLNTKLEELTIAASFNVNDQEEPICQNEHANSGLEISVPCETISVASSNSMLIRANDKDNLKPTNGQHGNSEIKGSSSIAESCLQSSTKVHDCKYRSSSETGIGHNTFIDVDEKDGTPCSSCRSRVITEGRDAVVDFQSSDCASFSVCLSDDVQSSLELPKEFSSHLGKKLKNERKIVVLQDLSMKCWPVLYHQNLSFIGFIGGWVDFARANGIRRGDICRFELVSKTEYKFRVQIAKQDGSMFGEKVVGGSTD